MKLVQIYLPRCDNTGRRFPASSFERERQRLLDRFGGMTAYTQAPAVGLWKDGPKAKRDELIIFEVLIRRVDRKWWTDYRYKLQKRFRQKQLLVRVLDEKLL